MSTARIDNVGPSAGGTTRKLVRGTAAAWANLNGTGTIALRDSENVSSVVDNGTGDSIYNLTNAMTSAGYNSQASSRANETSTDAGGSNTASSVRIITGNASGASVDVTTVTMSIDGDLA